MDRNGAGGQDGRGAEVQRRRHRETRAAARRGAPHPALTPLILYM